MSKKKIKIFQGVGETYESEVNQALAEGWVLISNVHIRTVGNAAVCTAVLERKLEESQFRQFAEKLSFDKTALIQRFRMGDDHQ